MDAEQAIEKIKEIRRQGQLARIFLDGRDCGAYWPAMAAQLVRETEATHGMITFDITMSRR